MASDGNAVDAGNPFPLVAAPNTSMKNERPLARLISGGEMT